jgi:hypothetical protein
MAQTLHKKKSQKKSVQKFLYQATDNGARRQKKLHIKIKTKKICANRIKASKNRDKNYIFVLHGS